MTVSKENAEHYQWGDHCDGWHLAKTPGLSVIQERLPPGAGESRHRHQYAEQFFYVLSGEARLEVAGTEHRLRMGEGAAVPSGAAHQIRNSGDADLHCLVISTPPSHGDRTPA
ncbi:cupin domain-containing protein [Marinobacter hydrocarbonoclasticus]|nr:cupin domain-containing protein [Marinobacter nauticus]